MSLSFSCHIMKILSPKIPPQMSHQVPRSPCFFTLKHSSEPHEYQGTTMPFPKHSTRVQVTLDSREFVLRVFVYTRPKNIIIYLICAICLLIRNLLCRFLLLFFVFSLLFLAFPFILSTLVVFRMVNNKNMLI